MIFIETCNENTQLDFLYANIEMYTQMQTNNEILTTKEHLTH